MKTINETSLTINRKALIHGLKAIRGGVGTLSQSTPMSYFSLQTLEKNRFLMTAYAAKTWTTYGTFCKKPSEVDRNDRLILPFNTFNGIAHQLSGTSVNIGAFNDHSFQIVSDNFECWIEDHDAEIPEIPKVSSDTTICVSLYALKEALREVLIAAPKGEECHPRLKGVLFEFKNGKLTLVATDMHKMIIREIENASGDGQDVRAVLQTNVMKQILEFAFRQEEIIQIDFSDHYATFSVYSDTGQYIRIRTTFIGGRFPAYEKAIRSNNDDETTIIVNRGRLLAAVLRARSIVHRNYLGAYILFKTSWSETTEATKFSVEGRTYSESDSRENIDALVTGNTDLEIAFNPDKLISILQIIPDNELCMRFHGSLSQIKISPKNTSGRLYLLMPMKVHFNNEI